MLEGTLSNTSEAFDFGWFGLRKGVNGSFCRMCTASKNVRSEKKEYGPIRPVKEKFGPWERVYEHERNM